MKKLFAVAVAAIVGLSVAPVEVEAKEYKRKVSKRVVISPKRVVVPKRYVGRPVYRAPVKKVYVGKPYRAGWNYWAHPIASAIAFAIVVDAAGNLQTEEGSDVVVLGGGGKVKETYTQDGVVYIITE
ncbi:hypothetical protein ABXV18_26955 [Vibrio owensii]|uniref:hypothetical protein n=1 Tax=Vibrio owensii TaxID=696485 RepID=UPI0033953977